MPTLCKYHFTKIEVDILKIYVRVNRNLALTDSWNGWIVLWCSGSFVKSWKMRDTRVFYLRVTNENIINACIFIVALLQFPLLLGCHGTFSSTYEYIVTYKVVMLAHFGFKLRDQYSIPGLHLLSIILKQNILLYYYIAII